MELVLSRKQIAEADRIAIEEYGIAVEQLMELAGFAVAEKAREICAGKLIVLLVGKGNNGGDALVAGRHLHNWGFEITAVHPFPEQEFKGIPKQQFEILKKMQIKNFEFGNENSGKALQNADLIIDGLFGFNLESTPRGKFAELIEKVNSLNKRVLAVDLPSGLDADSGKAEGACINASATVTFAAMKKGLTTAKGKKAAGDVSVADIGIPKGIYGLV